jgi:Polysaccharide lyase 14
MTRPALIRILALPVLAGCLVATAATASAASRGATGATAGPAGIAPMASAAGWTGTFDGFPAVDWQSRWGMTAQESWGFDDMTAVADPAAPGGGAVLRVTYGAGSSARSCTDCPTAGGGEFYTLFQQVGHADWTTAASLDLRYYVKFPTGYDWGRAGKLPGLFGGDIAQESGGTHGNGFSARYMWRGHNSPSDGEVYFYSPAGSGYGQDLGLGRWKFAADGKWHAIEQQVDRSKQTITVWYDGRKVYSTKVSGISKIPFSGVFFSTFFGGHERRWGPRKQVDSYFADFSVSPTVQH